MNIVPAPIERVVQTCLAKSPDHRPRHARELAEMYRDALAVYREVSGTTPELDSDIRPELDGK